MECRAGVAVARHCADELEDFLTKRHFFAALDANRVTRLAARNLTEAVRLVTMAADTALMAKDKQHGRDR